MDESRPAAVESPGRVLRTALIVSLVCAALVSTTAVLLRPRIEANRAGERRRHMLDLVERLPGAESLLASETPLDIEAYVIELATGHAVRSLDAATYDQRKAALDPLQSIELTAAQDIASIQRRANYATVHLVRHAGVLKLIILPIHGGGYNSPLYGFIALEGDANTVVALSFFEHEETPGLGAEIDSPEWRAKWRGKRVRDEAGRLRIGVAPGRIPSGSPDAPFQVDGISGATVTSGGVAQLLRFWLGEHGFGPFLAAIQDGGGA